MKVSINSPIIEGPYGGGNTFVQTFSDNLIKKDVKVINHLNDSDIDIILIVNVTFTYSFNFYQALIYKLHHPQVLIIHRVNDSGYQREDNLMTRLMSSCSQKSDHIIYISSWLKNEMLPKLKKPIPSSVILNGIDSDKTSFLPKDAWNGNTKLKIVTHHWSNNSCKGHNFYQSLDGLLSQKEYKKKYEFTYIGNYPKNLKYHNTKLLPVMNKIELKDELRKNHIYLTGSKNEAAGYHAIEGISLGLPILFYDSGGIPEYCSGYGIKFRENDFEEKLNEIREQYNNLLPKVGAYNFSTELMTKEYLLLFENLLKNQKIIRDKRSFVSFYIKRYYFLFKDISLNLYKVIYSKQLRTIFLGFFKK